MPGETPSWLPCPKALPARSKVSAAPSPRALWLQTERMGTSHERGVFTGHPLRAAPDAVKFRSQNNLTGSALAHSEDGNQKLPKRGTCPKVALWISSRSFSLSPNPQRCGKQAKSDRPPQGPGGVGRGAPRSVGGRGSWAPPHPPPSESRQHQGQLPGSSPQPPTTARAGPAARAPRPARARASPPARAPRARDQAGAARVPLSHGASPGVRSRGRSRSWQGAPAWALGRHARALGASPAPAAPARPQQAPQPWPGHERPLLAARCPGRTPDRPVTCAQVLGGPGQRRSHGSR